MGWNADVAPRDASDACACGERSAAVFCHDCSASYCDECSYPCREAGDHRMVTINSTIPTTSHSTNLEESTHHATTLEQGSRLPLSGGAFDASNSQSAYSAEQAPSSFFTSIDADARNDPDQELSPTPPTKAASSATDSSYDLWGSWSVRAYRHRAETDHSLDKSTSSRGLDEWSGFKSVSTDSTPALSPVFSLADDENLSLSSLNKPFRSMSFASNSDDEGDGKPSDKRTPRPRSFSDYTSLGTNKLTDIWTDRVAPAMPSHVPVIAPSPGIEIFRGMKTSVASRHVIIKTNNHEELDSFSIRSLLETLNGYGAVASVRDDFAHDGILFCTFYELKAAIGAVKMWFTNSGTLSPATETAALFSVPYEPLSEINCATVLVQLHGGGLVASFSDMRQLCSRYGEVASVLDKEAVDGTSNQYIIEFNDVRDVPSALVQLTGAILPSGHIISISRSHPPTFDPMKIKLFQDRVQKDQSLNKPRFVGNRPKSYSESTTMLASPSSSSPTSPLAMSFLDVSEHSREADDRSLRLEPTRGSPPFSHRLPPTSDVRRVRDSARPRSSSAYASLSTATPSSLLSDGYGASSSAHSPPFIPSDHRHSSSGLPHHPYSLSNQRIGPIRTASDPGFRHSYASSTCSSTGSVGRNDQGTGEFSLSIEKVASGEDTRTTLMVRNIPNKYTQQMLLSEINVHHHGKYDFFYLPIDFKNKCNMGYAFINFIEAASIVPFYQEFDSQKWTNFNSEKVCAISYARLQGKQAMITRFQNSSLLDKHESYRPLVFHSSGPNRGKPETFPAPKQTSGHHHHHHGTAHHFIPKKPHPGHQQFMMTASDEYLLGRLYAQQQHAIMANAHAAAAMLHSIPGLAVPPNSMAAPFIPQRSYQFRGGYPPQGHGVDRRHGHAFPQPQGSGAAPQYPGSGYSSTSA